VIPAAVMRLGFILCAGHLASAARINGPGPAAPSKAAILKRMEAIWSTYSQGYQFPRWAIEHYAAARYEDFEQDASACAIFYDAGEEIADVIALAEKREPVNIAFRRSYDQDKLQSSFGWRKGLYDQLHSKAYPPLAPNIAVLCVTPVVSGVAGPDEELSQEQLDEIHNPGSRAHVLSVVGYAFDNPKQPDQKHFLKMKGESMRKALISNFERVFGKIFAAALHAHLSVVVLSKFGAGVFAENYPGDITREVWLPAFQASLETWASELKAAGVTEISLMGGKRDSTLESVVKSHGLSSRTYGYFPEPLRAQLKAKLAKALLVNAWDGWSMIGNGNFRDNSLDGFMGRSTAMAVLGWPKTNPHLADSLVAVKHTGIGSKPRLPTSTAVRFAALQLTSCLLLLLNNEALKAFMLDAAAMPTGCHA